MRSVMRGGGALRDASPQATAVEPTLRGMPLDPTVGGPRFASEQLSALEVREQLVAERGGGRPLARGDEDRVVAGDGAGDPGCEPSSSACASALA